MTEVSDLYLRIPQQHLASVWWALMGAELTLCSLLSPENSCNSHLTLMLPCWSSSVLSSGSEHQVQSSHHVLPGLSCWADGQPVVLVPPPRLLTVIFPSDLPGLCLCKLLNVYNTLSLPTSLPHCLLLTPVVTFWLSLVSLNVLVPGNLCLNSFCVFCWGIFSVSLSLILFHSSDLILERLVCRDLPWILTPRQSILSECSTVSFKH